MPQTVVRLEDLRVAEIVRRIAEVVTLDGPEDILGPGLEIGRSGAEDDLAVGASAIVSGIINIVQAFRLVIDAATGTEGGILHIDGSAVGKNFSQGGIAGAVGGRYPPKGMEVVGGVILELLKIQDFEFARLGIVERHRVTHTADGRRIVGTEPVVVRRSEIFGRSVPVTGRIAIVFLVAGKDGQPGQAGASQILQELFHNPNSSDG